MESKFKKGDVIVITQPILERQRHFKGKKARLLYMDEEFRNEKMWAIKFVGIDFKKLDHFYLEKELIKATKKESKTFQEEEIESEI